MNPIYKRKIINDPVYGFINLPEGIVAEIASHPYFQRLRRIKQLGLTSLVYPGACHTRFQHALGAMHLMTQAIVSLRLKGRIVSNEEEEAAQLAVLLHDIGHGPFSHALESTIVEKTDHEKLSSYYFDFLNRQFDGKLGLALAIFNGSYARRFLHQLVASQLDTDRLDYLRRDSFFTGVSEGSIGSDRIIKMLDVVNDELVVEEKGIYSIEQFLIARRLMYWQVYYHKTVISAELLLIKILARVRWLVTQGHLLFSTPALAPFLRGQESINEPQNIKETDDLLAIFSKLDDSDLMVSIKVWKESADYVLSELCRRLSDRDLLKVEFLINPLDECAMHELKLKVSRRFSISVEEAGYFAFSETITKNAYKAGEEEIKILFRNGAIESVSSISDIIDFNVFGQPEKKYMLVYPKEIAVINGF